jgi:hypothetical protein
LSFRTGTAAAGNDATEIVGVPLPICGIVTT